MNRMILQEICDVANQYDITPKNVVNIYNKIISKTYINKNTNNAIELLNRYVARYYDMRDVMKYKVQTIHEIVKW